MPLAHKVTCEGHSGQRVDSSTARTTMPVAIPAERLLPVSTEPGPAGYPAVKVRAADAGLLNSRSVYHQETGELIKDYLKYDEVPGVTNCSVVTLPPGLVIERHVHPSKYEIFLTSGGRGLFKVWAPGAAEADEPREVFELKPGVCCTIGPEEPHMICAAEDCELTMTYLGVVAPETKA
jgi:quercetin dioxygenase-like cupin family protein